MRLINAPRGAADANVTIENGLVNWDMWRFRVRVDKRPGVVISNVDVNELYLDVHEDQGFCGPCQGCVMGCGE